MPSASRDSALTCTACEGRIVGRAEFHVGLAFCCAGCVVGGPCTCSYDVPDPEADVVDARVANGAGERALVTV